MRRSLLSWTWAWRFVLAVVLIVSFAFLGRWQWNRAMSVTGSLQNLLYAIEWWVFAAVVVFGLGRLLHDDLRAADRGPTRAEADAHEAAVTATLPAYARPSNRRRVQPLRPEEEVALDAELAAYNAYLARLNANPRP